MIEPMLAPGASIGSFRNQLVVRTTPANHEEIRQMLAGIDTAPRRLLVTVAQEGVRERERRAAAVSGSAGAEGVRVIVPEEGHSRGSGIVLRGGDDRIAVRAHGAHSVAGDRSTQSVQVLEGGSAYIEMGRSLPITTRRVERAVVGGRVVERVVEETAFHDAASGFHVSPRLAGDRVMVDISPRREAFGGRTPGTVQVQRMSTTLTGRLGEWMEVGGGDAERTDQRATLTGGSAARASERRRVLVKVEELR